MRHLTTKYSLIMAFYWSIAAVLGNYASVYLLGQGFKNTQIGLIIATTALLSAIVQPLIGTYADKPHSPSVKIILIVIVAFFLVFAILIPLFSERSLLILTVVYAIALVLMQIMPPLINSLGTISIYEGYNVNFGIARGIGSLVFAIVSLIIGSAISHRGIFLIPLVSICLCVFYVISLIAFPFEKTVVPVSKTIQRGFLKKYPSYVIVLIAAIFLYISHGLINNFAFQIITSKGGDSESLGVAFAIAAVMELPLMFFFSRLLRKFTAGQWLIISGFAYVVKGICTLLVTSVVGFYCAQMLQILSYAVITVASVYFINDIMKPEDTVKGQTFFTMTNMIGSVFASAFGGWLLDVRGVSALLVVAICLAIAGALVMWYGVKKSKKDADCTKLVSVEEETNVQ